MPGLQAAIVPVTAFQQNCAILWDEATHRGTVVDPGGDVPRILDAVEKLGAQIENIILTHGHLDHASGAASLKEVLEKKRGDQVPIEGPDERDRFLLEHLEEQAAQFGLADARNVLPDRWLSEGDTVTIAGQDFSILHCPGHTPGSLVYVNHPARFALMGDVLFQGSVGRTDFPYGDGPGLIRAIRGKLLPLGDDFSFLCGHGPGSTIGRERASNPFLAEGRR